MNPVHREDNYKKYLKYLTGTDEQQAPFNYKVNELVKSYKIAENDEGAEFDVMSISILIWSLLVVLFTFAFNGATWPIYGFAILLLFMILSRIDNHELYAKALAFQSNTDSRFDATIETTRNNLRILKKKYLWLFVLFTIATSLTMVCGYHLLNPKLGWLSIFSALVLSSVVWYAIWLSKSISAGKDLDKFEKELKSALIEG